MDIKQIREQYPQYNDLSDKQLVDGLHSKFYSDIPVNEFYKKVGFAGEQTSNPLKGAAARGASLLGEGVEAVARVAEKAGDYMESKVPLSNLTKEQIEGERQLEPMFKWADSLKNWGKEINYAPTTKLKDLSDNPLTVVPFVAERIVASSPDMAAAVVAMPAYVVSRTNEILNERLKNDNKSLDDATIADVATAAGAATVEATLERFATKGLLKPKGAATKEGTTAGRIGKETAIQSSTEGIEEGIGYLGGTAGTQKGVDPKELAENVIEGAIVGGGLGTTVQGGKEILNTKADKDAKQILAEVKKEETGIEPGRPIPKEGQGELFTEEEAPLQVTPSERTAVTQAGEEVIEPILDEQVKAKQEEQAAAQAQIDILQERISMSQDPAEIADLRQQVAQLEATAETPQIKLTRLRDEYDALERERVALQEAHKDAPTLKDKGDIIEQARMLYEQQQSLEQEIKTLRKELGKEETARPGTPEAKVEGQAEFEFDVPPVVNKEVARRFGFSPKATKILNDVDGLDMRKEEDRQALRDLVEKHERKGAKVDVEAVDSYISNFEEGPKDVGIEDRPVAGVGEQGVPVPRRWMSAATGVSQPVSEGLESDIGVTGKPDNRKGIPGEVEQAALETPTQTAAQESNVAEGLRPVEATAQPAPTTPAGRPAPADANAAQKASMNYQGSGGAKAKKPKSSWIGKQYDRIVKAHEGGSDWIDAFFGKLQNWSSFDQAYNNRMRKYFVEQQQKGDITLNQLKQALLRISTSQALHRANLANQGMEKGKLEYDADLNRWVAVDDPINMRLMEDVVSRLATRLGISEQLALSYMDRAYEANRLNSFYDDLNKVKGDITRTENRIKQLKAGKRDKTVQKELDTKQRLIKELEKRQQELEGKVQHMSRNQVQQGMQLYNNNPEIKEGTEIWNTMRERTVKMMVDTGLLTEEKAQDWLDEAAYVPFFRDMGEEKASGPVIITGGLQESLTPLRAAMVGSEREVSSTVGNMFQWMQWATAASISNQQKQVMIREYKKALPDEVQEGKGPEGNTFSIFEDGKQKFYTLADPATAQAFTHIAPIVFPGIAAWKGASNVLRHSVTRLPFFPIAQIPMDAYAAIFTSGLKSPFGVTMEIVKEIARTSTGTSKTRDTLKRSGVLETGDYNALTEAEAIGERLGFEKPGKWQATMKALDRFASVADNVIRQGVYNQSLKEAQKAGTPLKVAEAEAAERAAEIINFRRLSGLEGVQLASQTVPFFNAWNQILSVTIKTLSGRGITPNERTENLRVLRNTAAKVAALSFIYAAVMGDDEGYDKKNREIRDRMIMIPGTDGMGIPLRADLFLLPKVMGEYAWNMLTEDSFTDAKMFKNALARSFKGSFMPPSEGIPQLIRPTLGVMFNYDIYQDREIVNATMRKLDSPEQFNNGTSELAKFIGKSLEVSPLKVDYLIRGYFGGVASLFNLAFDSAIASAQGNERPERTWRELLSRMPNLGVAIGRTDNTAVVNDFYELSREVNKVVDTYKKKAESDEEAAEKYIQKPERMKYAGVEPAVDAIGGYIAELASQERKILRDKTMSGKQKAELIKEINELRKQIPTDLYPARKEAGF